jgi:hypothetical protein
MKKNRWYDKHKKLASLLEKFKGMRPARRDRLVAGVITAVKEVSPDLLEKDVMKYPLDFQRRRWYDADPYLWLIFNGLSNADGKLLIKVTAFLEKQFHPSKK